jgi:hypothetical protein
MNLAAGETQEPFDTTQEKIFRWLRRQNGEDLPQQARSAFERIYANRFPRVVKETHAEYGRSDIGAPEQELLEFFLEHHPEMATFMSTTTEGLSQEDRRKVAVAIFNGFKKLAIQAGEKLPDWFFDLERRFVAE